MLGLETSVFVNWLLALRQSKLGIIYTKVPSEPANSPSDLNDETARRRRNDTKPFPSYKRQSSIALTVRPSQRKEKELIKGSQLGNGFGLGILRGSVV